MRVRIGVSVHHTASGRSTAKSADRDIGYVQRGELPEQHEHDERRVASALPFHQMYCALHPILL